MTMTANFPGCCTAKVLYDFEPGQEWDGKRNEMPEHVNFLKNDIAGRLTLLKNAGYGTVVAITTHFQTNAEKALEELGFYVVDGGAKKNHPTTKTNTWVMPLNEWLPEGVN